MNIFILIKKILRQYDKLLSKIYFFMERKSYTGQLSIGDNFKLSYPIKTKFQGKGKIVLEDNIVFGYELAGSPNLPIIIQAQEKYTDIYIKSNSKIMQGCEFRASLSIHIGKNCLIGARSIILDADFHDLKPEKRLTSGKTSPVIIEDNVWIGMEAMILKGVTVGKDAVIAARCVVTKDVPKGAIVAGNPMKIIGSVYD